METTTRNELEAEIERLRERIVELEAAVAEHARSVSALRASERRYRKVVDDLGEMVVRWRPDGRATFVNEAYRECFGLATTPDQSPTELPAVVEQHRQRVLDRTAWLSPDRPSEIVEHEVVLADGTIGWHEWTDRAVFDEEGRVTELQSVGRDVTDRRLGREALVKSEERFAKAFEVSPHAVALSTVDEGRILEVNRGFEDVTGFSSEEAIGSTTLDLGVWPGPEDRERIVGALREGEGAVRGLELRYRRKTGEMGWARFSAEIIEIDGVSCMISMTEDVTRRKRAEVELLESRAKLRRLAMQLSAMESQERRRIATFLHDHIGQAMAVLRMKFGALGEASGDEAQQLISDIRSLLEQTISDTHDLTFALSPPILYELGLEAALEWMGEKICAEHGLEFDFADDGSPKPLVEDVAALLFRFVRELLLNVIKHARASRVTIGVSLEEGAALIRVEDNGVGFERQPATAGGGSGGFGLYSIRERLDVIGGHMLIDGPQGGGTRVRLWAPLGGAKAKEPDWRTW